MNNIDYMLETIWGKVIYQMPTMAKGKIPQKKKKKDRKTLTIQLLWDLKSSSTLIHSFLITKKSKDNHFSPNLFSKLGRINTKLWEQVLGAQCQLLLL